MSKAFTSTRQKRLAEQVASYGLEQRRLKAAAADRRAIAALRAAAEEPDPGLPARPQRPSVAADRGRHLR